MNDRFTPLSPTFLSNSVEFYHPPARARLSDPALDVLTDFRHVRPRTTRPDVAIDDALEHMKATGVRLLLVTDDHERLRGLVSSYDIQGELPIKLLQESRVDRCEILVGHIMTPLQEIQMLNLLNVRNARVGHIVATLRELGRKHLLVFERSYGDQDMLAAVPETPMPFATKSWPEEVESSHLVGEPHVCGLFSATQIGRRLGISIDEVMNPAETLADMQHDRLLHAAHGDVGAS